MYHVNGKNKNRQLHGKETSQHEFTSLAITYHHNKFHSKIMCHVTPNYLVIIIKYKALSIKYCDYVFLS